MTLGRQAGFAAIGRPITGFCRHGSCGSCRNAAN